MKTLEYLSLEEAFLLQYHLKMNYGDVRSLPLPYRRWFLSRLSDEFKSQNEKRKKSDRENSQETTRTREIPIDEMMDRVHYETFKKFE